MAHSMTIRGVTFIHDGDPLRSASPVEIVLPDEDTRVKIDVVALVGFVAEIVRSERIDTLEQATYYELLGLKK